MTHAHETMRKSLNLCEDEFQLNYYKAILAEYDALKAKAELFDEATGIIKRFIELDVKDEDADLDVYDDAANFIKDAQQLTSEASCN